MQTLDGHLIIFCEYTSMCECMHTTSAWASVVIGLLLFSAFLFWDRKPEAWSLPRWLDWLSCQWTLRIYLSLNPSMGVTVTLSNVSFFFFLYMGAVDPLSSPACIAITLVHWAISQPFYSLHPKLNSNLFLSNYFYFEFVMTHFKRLLLLFLLYYFNVQMHVDICKCPGRWEESDFQRTRLTGSCVLPCVGTETASGSSGRAVGASAYCASL